MIDTGIYPCRLAAVVILDNLDETSDQYRLVIQPAVARTTHNSVLFCEWTWSPVYYNVSPDTSVGPCFMICIKDDGSRILETKGYDNWAGEFIDLNIVLESSK